MGHETGFTADGLTDRLGGRGIVPSHFQAGVVRGLGEAMVGTLYEYAGSFTYSITPSGASSG